MRGLSSFSSIMALDSQRCSQLPQATQRSGSTTAFLSTMLIAKVVQTLEHTRHPLQRLRSILARNATSFIVPSNRIPLMRFLGDDDHRGASPLHLAGLPCSLLLRVRQAKALPHRPGMRGAAGRGHGSPWFVLLSRHKPKPEAESYKSSFHQMAAPKACKDSVRDHIARSRSCRPRSGSNWAHREASKTIILVSDEARLVKA